MQHRAPHVLPRQIARPEKAQRHRRHPVAEQHGHRRFQHRDRRTVIALPPEKDGPWFLMGLVRRHFRWQRDYRSPISMLETAMAMLLGYWVAPVTLCFFWTRYLARQDMRGTVLHVLLIALSVAAASCLPMVVSRVLRPGDLQRTKSKHMFPVVLSTLRVTLITGTALFRLSFGVIPGMPAERSIVPQITTSDIPPSPP